MQIQPLNGSAFASKAEEALQGALPFGRVFTPHIALIDFDRELGWHDGRIELRRPLFIDAAAMGLHYGQEGFEGLKAHYQDNGRVILFRPDAHAQRMQRTCERLCMPSLPTEAFVAAVEAIIRTDYPWVPKRDGASLYLRPTMLATEAALGVRPSNHFLFYVLAAPTGPYFTKGFSGIRVAVEREMTRAAPGGLGSAKTGANYVASLLAAEKAKQKGCDQVLWLDAIEHRYVEETGASNFFWLEGKTLYTAPAGDTVLRGITRDSILHLAPRLGLEVCETRIPIEDLITGIQAGRITEVFGTGTAAVVSPVSEILCDDKLVTVADGKPGATSKKLLDTIVEIHRGRADDPFGWCHPVSRPEWA